MGALACVFHRDGRPAEPGEVGAVADAMRGRGSALRAVWCDGPVGLGQREAWGTLPSEAGSLVRDAQAGLAIAADARLDNREELGRALGIGVLPRRRDAALILAAYRKWGRECAGRLAGDFAFVVWDARARTAFCARDPFGTRPVHYYLCGPLFVAASEVRAVLAAPGVPRRLDEGRLADVLVPLMEACDRTSTFFAEVFRLPPAHWLEVGPEGSRTGRSWSLDPSDELRLASDGEYEEAFRDLFVQAVRVRLDGVERPASMLSGGVDSSSVACVAREILAASGRDPLVTVSALADREEGCVESRHARAVLAGGGFEVRTVRPSQVGSYRAELDRLAAETDDPFALSMPLVHLVYAEAARAGAHVVFDGLDGDTVVSLGSGAAGFLLRQGRVADAVRDAAERAWRVGEPRWKVPPRLARAAASAFAPEWLRAARHRLRRPATLEAALEDSVIDRDFAARVGVLERVRGRLALEAPRIPRTHRDARVLGIDAPWETVGFERYDRVAASCGIEPRRPLLDRRLVEFCVSLPIEQSVRGGWTKWILRSATRGIVPDTVRWRRERTHLGPLFIAAWFGLERARVEEAVAAGLPAAAELVDVAEVRRRLARLGGGAAQEDLYRVWEAVTLDAWLAGAGAELVAGRTLAFRADKDR